MMIRMARPKFTAFSRRWVITAIGEATRIKTRAEKARAIFDAGG